MKNVLHNPTKSSTFFLALLFQHALFVPMMFFFAFWKQGPSYTYATLASASSVVAAVFTLLAGIRFFKFTPKEKVSFLLPLAFAIFPLFLSLLIPITTILRPNEFLPYEWGKYPRMVAEIYSIPFVAVTLIAVASLKLAVFSAKKDSRPNDDQNLK